jgi:aryl-alcohol dehydrogenase-like predicted oxidoreductase
VCHAGEPHVLSTEKRLDDRHPYPQENDFMTTREPNRRAFLQAGAAGVAALTLPGAAMAAQQPPKNAGGIPLRPLGRTGEMVSCMGLGGWHAGFPAEKASLRLIQRAVDEGITFMDNAWDYSDGVAEERMGKALAEGGRRAKVFLMTKACGRTAKDAESNLHDSLRRLRTDHLDLWQFHEINYDNDPDWVFADSGAIEAGLKAVKDGKVRFLGFTGHKDPAMHLKMLAKPYDWATVQMPLNVFDVHYRSFQKQVLPRLLERGIGVLAMKTLGGRGGIVSKAGVPVEDALRYVLSLPVSTLITGIDSEQVLDQNLKIVRAFKPLTAAEKERIERSTAQAAGDGRFELFKSAQNFDGPVHRKQHGFDAGVG